jgi:hypothetical protein
MVSTIIKIYLVGNCGAKVGVAYFIGRVKLFGVLKFQNKPSSCSQKVSLSKVLKN